MDVLYRLQMALAASRTQTIWCCDQGRRRAVWVRIVGQSYSLVYEEAMRSGSYRQVKTVFCQTLERVLLLARRDGYHFLFEPTTIYQFPACAQEIYR